MQIAVLRLVQRLHFHTVLFVSAVVPLLMLMPPANATRLPGDLKTALSKMFPDSKVRLDGAIETKTGELYLPLIAGNAQPISRPDTPLKGIFPDSSEPDLLSFSDGWFYLKVLKHGSQQTVVVPANLPDPVRKSLLACKFAPDLIVPQNFVLPKSLKPTVGEQAISFIEDPWPDAQPSSRPRKHHAGQMHVGVFVSCPKVGKITLLDEGTLTKLAEFPTEGTPAGLAYADGILYITDQSKHRILKLDPSTRQFVGQLNLPPHSAPKGVAALPNGKLLYVSESASNNVAVFETEANRLLVRTKVLSGPARMAVTPNGNALIVLNTPAGKITIMSTQNQKVVATVAVGTLPNAIAISPDSQRAYVSNRMSNTVSVIDIPKGKVIETLKTGSAPTGITLDEGGNRLFVANAKDNTISVFDLTTNKKLDEIKLPLDVDFPGALALLPNKHEILVSSEVTEAIGLLDTNALTFEKQPVIGYPSDEFLLVPIFSD